MMKWIWIAVASIFIGGVLVYFFYYNKPHRDIQSGKVDLELSADEMIAEFERDEISAQKKFDDKIILVSGKVKQVIDQKEDMSILLLDGSGGLINCEIRAPYDRLMEKVKIGEMVSIKGLFIGYNDLLGEIQLKRCVIENR